MPVYNSYSKFVVGSKVKMIGRNEIFTIVEIYDAGGFIPSAVIRNNVNEGCARLADLLAGWVVMDSPSFTSNTYRPREFWTLDACEAVKEYTGLPCASKCRLSEGIWFGSRAVGGFDKRVLVEPIA